MSDSDNASSLLKKKKTVGHRLRQYADMLHMSLMIIVYSRSRCITDFRLKTHPQLFFFLFDIGELQCVLGKDSGVVSSFFLYGLKF